MAPSNKKRKTRGTDAPAKTKTKPVPVRDASDDPVIIEDDIKRVRFLDNLGRVHDGPRWYDEETGKFCHVHDELCKAFERVGGLSLLTMNYPQYRALTSEFLATLESTVKSTEVNGLIKFQIGNRRRTVTMAEWNDIFDWPHVTPVEDLPDSVINNFWFRISGIGSFASGRSLGGEIANPVLRLAARILGHTVFARKECSKPHRVELEVLYHMLYQGRPNLGREFLRHLLRHKDAVGEIWFGGMITRIARHFEVDLSQYFPKQGSLLNVLTLQNYQFLGLEYDDEDSAPYMYKGMELPLLSWKMDLLREENWYTAWSYEPLPTRKKQPVGADPRERTVRYLFEPPVDLTEEEELEREADRRNPLPVRKILPGHRHPTAGSSHGGEGSSGGELATADPHGYEALTKMLQDRWVIDDAFQAEERARWIREDAARDAFHAEERARWTREDAARAAFYAEERARWSRESTGADVDLPPPPPPFPSSS